MFAVQPSDMRLLAAGLGGIFAGSLHAVTGPDHLAALLPLSVGRRWWSAINTGAYWGLGHGIGAALVGALAFLIRGAFDLDVICTYMEAAVGISIIIIGLNGIHEAREWAAAEKDDDATERKAHHSHEVVALKTEGTKDRPYSVWATLGTGILHGCSGSGHLLGVMPALAMPSWQCAAAYLTNFGLGTMLAMSCFTAVVGEASVRMGERLNQPGVPARMSLITSIFALVMGLVWTVRASWQLLLPQRVFHATVAAVSRIMSRFEVRTALILAARSSSG